MNRVRAFFVREAEECLETVRAALRAPDGSAREEAYRAIRKFRGSAQMARFGELAETARGVERRMRPGPGGEEWGASFVEGVTAVLEELQEGVEAARDGRLTQDPRMEEEMEEQEAGRPDADGWAGAQDAVVPIEGLEYAGGSALDRALDLRTPLEDAIVGQEPVGPIMDEIFDLIRLGRT